MTRWTLVYRLAVLALLGAIVLELRETRGATSIRQAVAEAARTVRDSDKPREETAIRPADVAPSPMERAANEAADRQIQEMLLRERAGRAAASQPGR